MRRPASGGRRGLRHRRLHLLAVLARHEGHLDHRASQVSRSAPKKCRSAPFRQSTRDTKCRRTGLPRARPWYGGARQGWVPAGSRMVGGGMPSRSRGRRDERRVRRGGIIYIGHRAAASLGEAFAPAVGPLLRIIERRRGRGRRHRGCGDSLVPLPPRPPLRPPLDDSPQSGSAPARPMRTTMPRAPPSPRPAATAPFGSGDAASRLPGSRDTPVASQIVRGGRTRAGVRVPSPARRTTGPSVSGMPRLPVRGAHRGLPRSFSSWGTRRMCQASLGRPGGES